MVPGDRSTNLWNWCLGLVVLGGGIFFTGRAAAIVDLTVDKEIKVTTTAPSANALGLGLISPEVLPIEYYRFFGNDFGVKVFIGLPLPYKLVVSVPADSTTVDSRLKVASPATDVDFAIRYGPHFGIEGLFFPFDSAFFFAGGLSYRRITIQGSAAVPLFVCFVVATVACNEDLAFFSTASKVKVTANAITSSLLTRASFGWLWSLSEHLQVSITGLGLVKPVKTWRRTNISASVQDAPAADEDEDYIAQGIERVRLQKEASLTARANDYSEKFDGMLLPVIGAGLAWRF